jgi:hypothetical protein
MYLVALLCGVLAIYEPYAVAIACQKLSHQFAPYASVSTKVMGLSEMRRDQLVKNTRPYVT